jgi:protein-tyrosine phosphatase
VKTTRVLFVCSGNICRSPMAAVIAEHLLAEAKIPALVLSAGTLGIQGMPASPHAVSAVGAIGLKLDGHRSQGVSQLLLRSADHVVVMAPHHEAELLGRDPSLAPKIRRLWEYAEPRGRLGEIADPVGLELEAFVACREDLEACLSAWVSRLLATR